MLGCGEDVVATGDECGGGTSQRDAVGPSQEPEHLETRGLSPPPCTQLNNSNDLASIS